MTKLTKEIKSFCLAESYSIIKNGADVLGKAHLFPESQYKIDNEIMIYDNKIAIYSEHDEIGLIIEIESWLVLSAKFGRWPRIKPKNTAMKNDAPVNYIG